MAEKHHLFSYLKQRKLFLLLPIALMVVIVFYNVEHINIPILPYINNKIAVPQAKHYKSITKTTNKKTILYWNTFFGAKDMHFGTGSTIFDNCSVKNCYATYDKKYSPPEYFDAIIFHAARYSVYSDNVPRNRSLEQKYIFYALEAPFNSRFDEMTNEHFYNWTMTYRKDSDIHRPYGLVEPSRSDYKMPQVQTVLARRKMVAWFVSNCHTEGSKRRMNYAHELSKFIPVDIYGACGSRTCTDRQLCYEMLEHDYKFYLSFENSMCKDYVTEKLFNILHYNVVPVVLGYFDYSTIAPPNSVINTRDFDTPETLAAYLWSLDADPVAYLRFFEWKHKFRITQSTTHALCQLCKLLHEPIKYFSYENIRDWFFGFDCLN